MSSEILKLSEHEKEIVRLLKKEFVNDKHYAFDIPADPLENEKLWETLKSLAYKGYIMILSQPNDGDDFILVEEFPPCCIPPYKLADDPKLKHMLEYY